MISNKIKLIIFDMDGVIFEGDNFWMDLHRAFGTLEKGIQYTEKFLKTNYAMLVDKVVRGLWKGKSALLYKDLIRKRKYEFGVEETLRKMNPRVKKAIITSGPRDLARRVQVELGIDFVFANELLIENDLISGKFYWPIGNDNKPQIACSLINGLKIDISNVAFVANDENDVSLASLVGHPIAYNSNCKELLNVCRYILNKRQFQYILNILGQNNG